MESVYKPHEIEKKWADLWEKGKYFTPRIDPKKKPFSIILPLPNANDPIHMGHALFTIQDIMVRYHRMLGDPTLWLPGGDHAGIETQYVFEKRLAKEGKSRFDFDRNTLYEMIKEFVEKNKDINKNQMKQLGFSLDWTRYHYSLEPEIVERVLETFRKLHNDGLIYRAQRLAHYCVKCGTAFSDLEIRYVDKDDTLYYLDYGPIKIATTRPETIFADTAVAVHPKDKRYKNLIGKKAIIPLINREVPIITDEAIQVDFGTGALKVTPAHDEVDYEIGLRHKLPIIETIDLNGRLKKVPEKYTGMKVMKAREEVFSDLKKSGKLIKTEPFLHSVSTCYRCNSTIEPMLLPQWYVKTKPLAKPALEAVKAGITKIVPKKRFEKMYLDWMENILDWNISRQIVWGPRIPAWYCLDCNSDISIQFITRNNEKVSGTYTELKKTYSYEEIINGLQSLAAPPLATYSLRNGTCEKCRGDNIIQESDTFDTWFLSTQWPVNTLKSRGGDFEYFYPTSVLDTLWDILFFWVGRMMMMGLYLTGNVPFKIIHIHARVVDKFGQKMSKSKGNVINPIELTEKCGADALRMALIYGTASASDISIGDEKVRGMRNFINKLWNAGRFILMKTQGIDSCLSKNEIKKGSSRGKIFVAKLQKEVNEILQQTTKDIEGFQFGRASDRLYQYIWHTYCDIDLEKSKPFLEQNNEDTLIIRNSLLESFLTLLKLLHPFIPFVTEELHVMLFPTHKEPLTVSPWPVVS